MDNQALKNFGDRVHAFVRYTTDEKLLIISSFDDKNTAIKVRLSEEAIKSLNLIKPSDVVGRDLLRSGAEIGFNELFEVSMDMPAFSSYIFKLK